MSFVDDLINQAARDGKFDNLPGKGKPLRLRTNPYEDPEWSLAYKALKNGGYLLPWIEKRKEIEAAIEAARMDLRRAWVVHLTNSANEFGAAWQAAVERHTQTVQVINAEIREFNLLTPGPRWQMLLLNLARRT